MEVYITKDEHAKFIIFINGFKIADLPRDFLRWDKCPKEILNMGDNSFITIKEKDWTTTVMVTGENNVNSR